MLTKDDLSQIRKIVREEVENEAQTLKDELQGNITMSRIRLQNDIGELKDRIKNIEIRLTKLENRVIRMHKELKNEIKMVANFLDKDNMQPLKRVKIIEAHLGITPA